ncbi:NnrS family protein [Comamonas composti]|uniref:NnrS family protein n=1 Tax=Comamonas composti TaxID=408558 RepID=UPI0003F6DE6E|nr:NnrS family protein [Comamonas composti]
MSQLLHLEEPTPARKPAPQWDAFLTMGFRPLYLLGCLWAALSVALWVFAPQWLTGRLGGVLWHAHEMLWAFVATIAVGFLLTAAGNWTGRNPLDGKPLAALCGLWGLARLGLLVPGTSAFVLGVVCELLFFAGAALAIGRVIYAARSRRNYGLPILLLGLGLADALFLWSTWQGDYALLMQRFYAGLLCMAVIALLIARRVIPFFAMRAVAGLQIPMLAGSGSWQLGASCVAIACLLAGWMPGVAAGLGLAGLLTLLQVVAWQPWAVRKVPLLWILYLGHAALGLGLLVAAAQAVGLVVRLAWPVHVIGVAGFSVLIIGMVTRTALGHLGRPLRTDASMLTAYGLVIAAAALRLLALWPSGFSLALLHASALVWVLGFGLYLWRFVPMLIRPRVDHPGPGAMRIRRA